jgi:hypothetical protein
MMGYKCLRVRLFIVMGDITVVYVPYNSQSKVRAYSILVPSKVSK